jgi:hypothetical protein
MMKKYKIVAFLCLSLFLLMCSNTKSPVTSPGEENTSITYKTVQSECEENSSRIISIPGTSFEPMQSACKAFLYKGDTQTSSVELEDSVYAWSSGNTVWVMHKNALVNCCSAIEGEVVQTSLGYDIFEKDTSTDLCFCLCYMDIVTPINSVSPGIHLIRVFDVDGNFVGQVELTIPSGEGTVIFSSRGDTIFVVHQGAFYNCCSEIVVDVMQTANGFDLFERDTSEELCYCMCNFDISTTIAEVAEGEYLVRLFDIYGSLVDFAIVTVYDYIIHNP